MVRLKVKVFYPTYASTDEFQFQYGSIKSGTPWALRGVLIAFQFQYGTIKRDMVIRNGKVYVDFNSNMVRLKAPDKQNRREWEKNFNSNMVRLKDSRHKVQAQRTKFQFQYGSIKSSSFLL